MPRWMVLLALAGCSGSGLGVSGGDLAPAEGRDAGAPSSDGAVADLAAAPPHWQAEPSHTTESLRGVWGSGSDDVYVVGTHGTILHSRGDGTWTAQTSGTTKDLHGIWGSSAHDLWAVGDVLLRSSGDGTWRVESTAPSGLMGVWGTSGSDVWVAGLFGISHTRGDGTWTAQTQAEPWGGYFHVRGRDAADVYAVGGIINLDNPADGGGVAHLSSGQWTWTRLSPPDEMKDLAFTRKGAFIVGLSGQIWANGSGTWMQQPSPVPWDLQAIWADPDEGLHAVGGSGTVLTSSGDGTWAVQASLTVGDLWGVWGSGALDLYAVGDDGDLFHYH